MGWRTSNTAAPAPTSSSIGTANGQDLSAEFDPYKFWGLERACASVAPDDRVRIGIATIGFRQVSELRLTIVTPGLLGTGGFYDGSTVPTFGFGGGFMFGSIGVEVMARYAGSLTAAADVGAPFVTSLANAGERWSLPISLVLRF